MDLKMIVAVGSDGAIGRNGDLIWKLPSDLKRFKALTTGHPVIMGRKTWESLPKKPLPGRRNIILTRQSDYSAEGAEIVNSLHEALKITENETPFIIGGAEIYNAALPYVSEAFLTIVNQNCPDADAFLNLDFFKDWEITDSSPTETTPEGITYRYVTYSHSPTT